VGLRLHHLLAAIFGLALTHLAFAAPPLGWIIAGSSPTHYVFAVDTATPVSGSKSASITAKPTATSNGFGTLMQMIAADDYRGSRLRFSGYLRTANADRSQMWMRVDGPNHQVLAFDNMDSRPIVGTTEWKRYGIVLDVPENAVDITFGFFLAGRGEVWGADFKLEKVGTEVPVTSRGPLLLRKPANLNFEAPPTPGNAQRTADSPLPAIAAGEGRIFIYPIRKLSGSSDSTEVKLNGNVVGTPYANGLLFADQPPGTYTVTVLHPGALSPGGGLHDPTHDLPTQEHALKFHLSAGQLRYVRIDLVSSALLIGQFYPKLVALSVGKAQTAKILQQIKSVSKR
jgi:hypothetical protein